MSLPYFFIDESGSAGETIRLNEETSRHVAGVLRMKAGDQLHLTDGKGNRLLAAIVQADKKNCSVQLLSGEFTPRETRRTAIGMSLLKNAARLEWFLEKATEMGIMEIIPLVCDRTEKHHFRSERMRNILVSAMLQSQQVWLPVLHEPIGLGQLLRLEEINGMEQKFIAHCLPGNKVMLSERINKSAASQIVLIGPEGDFTKEEVDFALSYHFTPVSLGNTRLRAETAGMAAAVLLHI